MRKRKKGRKLHRKRDQRKALKKILGESLILKEKIITTKAKAKELQSFLEKKITKAKKGDLASQREISKYFSKKATRKLIKEIAPRFYNRKGGYTRIIKIGKGRKDASEMVKIEIIK